MKQNKFFVDGRAYYTTETALIGGDIKKMANTSLNYPLYVEQRDGTPDRYICDGEAIRLDEEILHFFVVPPATF